MSAGVRREARVRRRQLEDELRSLSLLGAFPTDVLDLVAAYVPVPLSGVCLRELPVPPCSCGGTGSLQCRVVYAVSADDRICFAFLSCGDLVFTSANGLVLGAWRGCVSSREPRGSTRLPSPVVLEMSGTRIAYVQRGRRGWELIVRDSETDSPMVVTELPAGCAPLGVDLAESVLLVCTLGASTSTVPSFPEAWRIRVVRLPPIPASRCGLLTARLSNDYWYTGDNDGAAIEMFSLQDGSLSQLWKRTDIRPWVPAFLDGEGYLMLHAPNSKLLRTVSIKDGSDVDATSPFSVDVDHNCQGSCLHPSRRTLYVLDESSGPRRIRVFG